jgi:hypothetical protein
VVAEKAGEAERGTHRKGAERGLIGRGEFCAEKAEEAERGTHRKGAERGLIGRGVEERNWSAAQDFGLVSYRPGQIWIVSAN